jgi:genome maintenance exonuclease 1
MARGRDYDAMVVAYGEGEIIAHKALLAHLDTHHIISTEQTVTSPRGYRGRYDAILEKDGVVYLNDFKGAGKPKDPRYLADYWMQVGAYVLALEEGGEVIDGGMITVILEDGLQVFTLPRKALQPHIEQFLKRFELFKQNELQCQTTPTIPTV